MISRQDLERLAKVKSDHGILSAYVRLDPRLRFVRRQAVAQFKGAFKAAQRRIQEGSGKMLSSERVLMFSTSCPTGSQPVKAW